VTPDQRPGAGDRVAALRALLADDHQADPHEITGRLRALCRVVARTLPASGAGVSLLTAGMHAVAASSDPVSEHLEGLQFTLGEGPCLDAIAARQPVLEPDLARAASRRWLGYGPAAMEQGARAVFAFPLQIGGVQLGVLDVYRDEPGGMSADALTEAMIFADLAVETLIDGQEHAAAGRAPEDLDRALDPHYLVYQAQGMTMIDLGVPLDEAMARLRAYAYAHGRPLRAVAADIVAGRLQLQKDHP
jgi:GAF domain-containing protein